MAEPIEITNWATSGSALKTATDSSRWNLGWQTLPDNLPTDTGERPNLNQQNYWQNSVHVWLQYLNARAIPSGSLTAFAGASTPSGYLPCDGLAVSRVTYADLFAAIGTAWGIGDGATTFNMPDLGGRALKGAGTINDGQGGVTVTLGSFQDDSTASNGLSNATSTVSGVTGTNTTSSLSGTSAGPSNDSTNNLGSHGHGITDPTHAHTQDRATFASPPAGQLHDFAYATGSNHFYVGSNGTGPSGTGISTVAAGSHSHTLSSHTHTTQGTAAAQGWSQSGTGTAASQVVSGDTETRPKAYGVNWIIKT